MKVLIIEDESHSAERLQRYIRTLHPDYEISGVTKSIAQSIEYLQQEQPDLIFSDIRLQDGLSFDIFRTVKVASPIIFTTAYDQYAIQAFKFNSIDYLLKPIDSDELETAIQKAIERLSPPAQSQSAPLPVQTDPNIERLLEYMGYSSSSSAARYRERFLVSRKDEYITIEVRNVCFIHSQQNITRLYLTDGTSAAISSTLDQLDKEMNPASFFRANRQYMIQVSHIKKVNNWFNYKLKVEINGYPQEEILISREKAAGFKKWLDK